VQLVGFTIQIYYGTRSYKRQKCFLFHKLIPLISRNIQVFRKACAKYPAEKFGELGLTGGI